MPESHRSLDSGFGTPLNCLHHFILSFPLEPFRKMIKVSESSRVVKREANKETFWSEVVQDVADAWQNESSRTVSFVSTSQFYYSGCLR